MSKKYKDELRTFLLNPTVWNLVKRCQIVLLSFLVLTSCATINEKMQRHITEGKFNEAITAGETFIAKKPDAPEASTVRTLLMDAEFRLAKTVNTLDRYDAYALKFSDHPYKQELIDAEYALYKVMNTIEGYDEFNLKFPEHPHSKEVIEAEYILYKEIGTLEAYDAFDQKFPDHPFKQDLMERKAKVYYETETLPAGTAEAFRDFRTRYPQSTLAAEALEKENKAAFDEAEAGWRKALGENTLAAFDTFCASYAYSTRVPEAREMICGLAFKDAENRNSLESYEAYIRNYPSCSSKIRIARSRTGELAWKNAESENTWEAYRTFSEKYPESPYVTEARTREKNLWEFSGPLRPDELNATVVTMNDKNPDSVRLLVRVQDEGKEAVGGLPMSSFSIWENACPVRITEFNGMESELPVDIVFLFDTSGSMGEELTGVKNASIQFAENLRLRSRNSRIALVTFAREVREIHDFTSDIQVFKSWVAHQSASGGGDDPENPLEAMAAAFKLSYRPDAQIVYVFITDEPCHEKDSQTSYSVSEMAAMVKEKSITFFAIAPDIDQYRDFVEITNGSLFVISDYPDFSGLIEHISTVTAKQYLIAYQGSSCGAKAQARSARVRVRQNCMWMPTTKLKSNDVVDLMVSEDNPDRVYAITGDAGIFRSTDGGMKWGRVGETLSETSFQKMFSTGNGSIMALSKTGKLYYSNDGIAWLPLETHPALFSTITQNPLNRQELTASDGQNLYHTSDGGTNWSHEKSLNGKAPLSLVYDPGRKDTLIMLGMGDEIRTSTDRGRTWKAGRMTVPETGTHLSDYRLYLDSRWKGATFLMRPDGHLYRSSDSGMTWVDITPLAGSGGFTNCRNLRFDPTSRHWLMMGTGDGVMASNDNGNSWFGMGEGMADADRKSTALGLGPDGRVQVCSSTTGNMYQLNPVADREFISGSVYFVSGSADINDNLMGYLDDLTAYLDKHKDVRVVIEGHTDDVGKDEYNQRLSEERADVVRDYLSKRGIDPDRIRTMGHGKNKPLVPNTDDKNRTRNRRVELTLLAKWKV
jgi:outer membrane protein OmpA-like peptidoglycan-associated protein/uncharacterized protein YegL/outer membrane protein assembly factor BamD (BamD/ComL family)